MRGLPAARLTFCICFWHAKGRCVVRRDDKRVAHSSRMKSQQRFRRTHFTDRLLFGRAGFVISRNHAPLPFAFGASRRGTGLYAAPLTNQKPDGLYAAPLTNQKPDRDERAPACRMCAPLPARSVLCFARMSVAKSRPCMPDVCTSGSKCVDKAWAWARSQRPRANLETCSSNHMARTAQRIALCVADQLAHCPYGRRSQ